MEKYIEQHKERFFNELFEILRIPSISSSQAHRPDMQRCAEKLVSQLLEAGAEKARIYPTEGHPVVYAEKIIDPAKPTVLIYGHYDVQPVDPLELWHTPPFEPDIRKRSYLRPRSK